MDGLGCVLELWNGGMAGKRGSDTWRPVCAKSPALGILKIEDAAAYGGKRAASPQKAASSLFATSRESAMASCPPQDGQPRHATRVLNFRWGSAACSAIRAAAAPRYTTSRRRMPVSCSPQDGQPWQATTSAELRLRQCSAMRHARPELHAT
jgi:hypothetical protein